MNDQEKILKIQEVLKKVDQTFKNSISPGISRQDYIKEHNIKTGINYSFSLSADDIIKNKIPRKVVGCTGVAKVFSKFSKDMGLESYVVSTARLEDWKQAKIYDKKHEKRNIINGHQIIGVKFSDGIKVFDPARSKLTFIKGDIVIGGIIKSIGNEGPDYLISAISTPDNFAQVISYQNIANIYTSGNINDDSFKIKPKTNIQFKLAIKNINKRIFKNSIFAFLNKSNYK